MKFTLSWLKEHLETTATLDEITTALTAIGLEVESVEDRAALYAPFKTAKVVSADKHPDADRLKVLKVDAGDGNPVQVVCGAPNARAGMTGVFAPEGSYIPGLDTVLKKGTIRGVESCGMMVSEREMKLSDEHTGIIDLPDDLAAGLPMAPIFGLDDPLIEINLTPNRADCAGVRGIARDLAAKGLGTLKPLDLTPVAAAFDTPVGVRIECPESCPQFLGRLIRGVKNGPSPEWLQRRLKSIGLRPISVLVDITNYFTIGLNRPLHVFDADRLQGDIVVRKARNGETLAALNDKTYELDETMTAVCDDSGVLGLGGVIGGTATGCHDTTANVYVECAYFTPQDIAFTGRALQINSDARYRFERGIDPAFTAQGMALATRLILALCGGEAGSVIAAGPGAEAPHAIAFDPARTAQMTGLDLSHQEQHRILVALGFACDSHVIPWQVTPPSWRPDIEGAADLVEEVARIHGFDSIPPVSFTRTGLPAPAWPFDLKRRGMTRRALAARGLKEAVTWSFMRGDQAAVFESEAFSEDQRAALTLTNPISSEMDRMRPSILPNLLQAAQRNADRGFPNAALFEVGPVFRGTTPGDQSFTAAGIRHLAIGAKHWSGAQTSRAVTAYDAKADALAALEACGVAASKVQIGGGDAPGYYHPGRSASLCQGKTVLGWFGEIHPRALEALDVKGPAAGFEIFPDRAPAPKKAGSARPLLKPSPFQPVTRDFAFIADLAVEAQAIARAAAGASRDLIDRIDVFDVYAGKGVEPGKKSIAIAVTLQPRERTLTDAEIEAAAQGIIKAVHDKTGAVLRA